ncbi:hypothetical protein M407DRAFT_241090 [Tulasnella calospora MUT 4182]|uniref:Uncharacterized protein n=1 Tax=Tulasnella calospora MUT 4182 TaxID=1051891 RepID=A0A0C3LH09_9AGAM|nr:hypothetical protein M407DRAFT_241090 [Tulasnella calospora MUT 4182]
METAPSTNFLNTITPPLPEPARLQVPGSSRSSLSPTLGTPTGSRTPDTPQLL